MKALIIFFIAIAKLSAGTWSLTLMNIATSSITPTVTSGMGKLKSEQSTVNTSYEKVREQVETQRAYIEDITTLDKLILVELQKANLTLENKKSMR